MSKREGKIAQGCKKEITPQEMVSIIDSIMIILTALGGLGVGAVYL